MNNERKPLNFSDLEDFEPRKNVSDTYALKRKEIDKTTAFPSREKSDDEQINIKAHADIVSRFRTMAKKERYRHGEFLEILMNAYEQKMEEQ
ncbi:hypothetical protein [Bartonella sp. cb54]|uniref:hypothetical protein n=1 Tax=Bartonella sp. cb54 TaxID=3385560 RepID=UPI0039A78554